MPYVPDALKHMLRPAGGGIHTVTTGRTAQRELQKHLYGASRDEQIEPRWLDALGRLPEARVVLLGIPCDTGAGLLRGQSLAPAALRMALLQADPAFFAQPALVDIGDIRVVPHLLCDDMLNAQTIQTVRQSLYGGAMLPVSPLSVAEHVLEFVLAIHPAAHVVMLGGDHSVAWPVVAALARTQREPWAIVQLDAHTDLLSERLGVKINFATWAYHANELLGRSGRLVQVGIRTSGRPREYWEQTLGVRQFWMSEICNLGDDATIAAIVSHLKQRGVKCVYVSNDIDGTDPSEAPSTSAPEPGGLSSKMVQALIRTLGQEFSLLGGDLVEVSPSLGTPESVRQTLTIATSYVRETVAALLKG